MDVYRVHCSDCDMKARLRLDESAAARIAKQHATGTGHETTVTDVIASDETVVTRDGLDEGHATGTPVLQD